MKLTPLQQTVTRLDKSLSSKGIEIGRWVVDNARPHIAVRHRNGVTVCFSCSNAMVYTGNDRFAKCCECGNIVEIIEENDWLTSKRMLARHFASLEVVEGIQVIRTYEIVFRYNAINRLKDYSVREICRHWITSDGRWAVTSLRHFIGGLMPWCRKMKLRKGSTEIEDHLANKASVIPKLTLIPELSIKIGNPYKLMSGNVLSIIRNILEPDYSIQSYSYSYCH